MNTISDFLKSDTFKQWRVFIQACLLIIFCSITYLAVKFISKPTNVKECVLDSTKSAESLRACMYIFK